MKKYKLNIPQMIDKKYASEALELQGTGEVRLNGELLLGLRLNLLN